MVWFVLGAAVGVAQFAWRLARRPMHGDHPVQAFAFVAVLGAAIYGTIFWLIANYVF